jgi:signal transduction histidine kinase
MAYRIRHIAVRFALILGLAAILPLVAYGIISIFSLQQATRESIVAGNLNVADRAAEEIRRYVSTNADILRSLAATLQGAGLDDRQRKQILENHVLDFREFREITLFGEDGNVIVSSRIGEPRVSPSTEKAVSFAGVTMSPIRLDQDGLPTALFAVHLTRLNQLAGWLVGELSLEEMWRMVDRIRLGDQGYALVAAPDGALIAHGDPNKKGLVAQSRIMTGHHPLIGVTPATEEERPRWREYTDESGTRQLAVSALIPDFQWTLVVEQPTVEAYAGAMALRRQLLVAISIALIVMMGFGLFSGRRFIDPIFRLQRATKAVADGNLDTRVTIQSADEFGKLGDSFNAMADRLIQLTENIKRQERQAMFGRIAAGLFHDLNHPIMNIGNNARLLIRSDADPEWRDGIHRTIEQNLAVLKRFMDDIRNIAKPKPIERFPVDVNTSVREVVEAMRAEGERAGVALDGLYTVEPLVIEGDRFALGRVYRNLVTNAIQATSAGGHVTVTTTRDGDFAQITIADTGAGIPAERLAAIFDDFVTTKRRGLGLGLAISKQIVEQLHGTIAVESVVGAGTSFTLRFPARDDLAAQAAAS